MHILVEGKTKSGKKVFEKIEDVEKVVFFNDVKAVFQINKDFKKVKPVKGSNDLVDKEND